MYRLTLFMASLITLATSVPVMGAVECDVTFALLDTQSIDALQMTVDYSTARGTFVGEGDRVQCESARSTVAVQGFDHCRASDSGCYAGSGRVLTLSATATNGVAGPTSFAICRFVALDVARPVATDFAVAVTAATEPGSTSDMAVPPRVSVADVSCH